VIPKRIVHLQEEFLPECRAACQRQPRQMREKGELPTVNCFEREQENNNSAISIEGFDLPDNPFLLTFG
jgi:hypothetical protein